MDLTITDPPYGIEGDRLHRHLYFPKPGATQTAIVQMVSREFARGAWAIRKRIRDLKVTSPAGTS